MNDKKANTAQREENQSTDMDQKPTPASTAEVKENRPKEIGGRKGPEPTRYGDWEKNGIISDF